MGIQLKIASNTRASAINLLKLCIEEIEAGTNSMFFPLNDHDDTEADISVVRLNDEFDGVYDSWDNYPTESSGL
jgi:hypothetical protein